MFNEFRKFWKYNPEGETFVWEFTLLIKKEDFTFYLEQAETLEKTLYEGTYILVVCINMYKNHQHIYFRSILLSTHVSEGR